jgi:hypothetical protein
LPKGKSQHLSRYASLFAKEKEDGVRLCCSNRGCKRTFVGATAFADLTRHSSECNAIKCYGAMLNGFEPKDGEKKKSDENGGGHGCEFQGTFDSVDEHMADCPKALFVLAERLDQLVKELEADRVEQTKRIEELEDALNEARWEAEERDQQFGDVDFEDVSDHDDDEDDEDYRPNARVRWPGAA